MCGMVLDSFSGGGFKKHTPKKLINKSLLLDVTTITNLLLGDLVKGS